MIIRNRHYLKFICILIFFISVNCQFQEPYKSHGIVFLENRANKLKISKSNKNDVIRNLGQPHSKSFNEEDKWIYIERVLTKGEYHKLGKHVLKSNNVLVLDFDKYGILKDKKFLNKDDKNKIVFSKNETVNQKSESGFVKKFLNSVRTKMYRQK